MDNISNQFISLQKTLVQRVLDLEKRYEEEMAQNKVEFETKLAELKADMPNLDKVADSIRGKDGEQGLQGEIGERGEQGERGKEGKPGKNGKEGKPGKRGDDGAQGERGEKGEDGKDGSPDTPEDIVTKLQSLEGEERLSATAIKDLDEYVKERVPKTYPQTIGFQRGFVKVYDLSPSLNGVTTTFSLPGFFRVLTVNLSSVPNILRPTTDYTTDANLMTITFTSEINPSTSLTAGQTCIILYQEP